MADCGFGIADFSKQLHACFVSDALLNPQSQICNPQFLSACFFERKHYCAIDDHIRRDDKVADFFLSGQ